MHFWGRAHAYAKHKSSLYYIFIPTIVTGLEMSQLPSQSSESLARSPGKIPLVFPSGKSIRDNVGFGTAVAILCVCGAQ